MTAHLSTEECEEVEKILHLRYLHALGSRQVKLTFEASTQALRVQALLRDPEEAFFYPIEAQVERASLPAGVSERDAALVLVDFIESYLDEFFESEEQTYLPIDWHPFPAGRLTVYARGQILNRKLEAEADRLLLRRKEADPP